MPSWQGISTRCRKLDLLAVNRGPAVVLWELGRVAAEHQGEAGAVERAEVHDG